MLLSIMGMYEYDNSLFDGLDCPSYTDSDNNLHVVNKTDVVNNILLKCAELEVIYPKFDTMKLAIGVWSAANQETWNRLYMTQMIEYNPIWNVDADVTINTIAGRGWSDGGTNTGSVQGYNSNTWADAEKNTVSNSGREDSGSSVTERRTGNIGVTATQDLIQKERDIAEFNIIDYMTESFMKRCCLMVY